eukprot:5187095-Amphidinium_carterae.1
MIEISALGFSSQSFMLHLFLRCKWIASHVVLHWTYGTDHRVHACWSYFCLPVTALISHKHNLVSARKPKRLEMESDVLTAVSLLRFWRPAWMDALPVSGSCPH